MTREEKCKLAIERGYTYDPETGLIYNRYGKIVKPHKIKIYIHLSLTISNKPIKIVHLFGHQFAWYWVNKECVEQLDHINGIKNDNRICNLRPVTHQQNQFNKLTTNGYTFIEKSKKYRSRIMLNKKDIHLGYYNTEEEARNAYLAAKEIYHKF